MRAFNSAPRIDILGYTTTGEGNPLYSHSSHSSHYFSYLSSFTSPSSIFRGSHLFLIIYLPIFYYFSADDWMLGSKGIVSMSPEVGAEQFGFWPPQHAIREINEKTFWHIVEIVMKSGK